MTTLKKVFGVAFWIAIAMAGYFYFFNKHEEPQKLNKSDRALKAKQRFDEWAYVAKEKQIAPGETVRLIIIPDPMGFDFMDTKCLIYTHREFRQSSMICPDATKENIAEDVK